MPGTTVYLREWSADDEEMSFTATDRFDGMDGTYRRGKYYPDGISLYDLAVDVFGDAGIDSRTLPGSERKYIYEVQFYTGHAGKFSK